MSYFVTGATGFIGRHLVEQLLKRDGDIHVLVREGSRGKLDELIKKWPADPRPHRARRRRPVEERLGVSDDDVAKLKEKGVRHFFHLAAIYDMTADDERNEKLNVDGTRNAVALANARRGRVLHHTSSIAAAGLHKGLFREDQFDEGQKLPSAYHRTKFESEKIAREESKVPWRVYRPAIVVGHSETGEMDKIDGPYYFFKVLQKLRHWLPEWAPLVAPEMGYTNVVPVDYVAKAMDHIAHQPDLDGQAFHLTNPKSQRSGEVMNEFAKAAHAPQTSLRIDNRILQTLPKGTVSMLMKAPPLQGRAPGAARRPRHPRGGPRVRRPHRAVRHARHRARAEGHRHRGPRAVDLRVAAVGLLRAPPRPRPLQGPVLRGRRQRQARPHHRRLVGHRRGGREEDRRRRRHPAARRAQRWTSSRRRRRRSRRRAAPRTSTPPTSRTWTRSTSWSSGCAPSTRSSTSSSTTRAARSAARSS